MASKQVRNLWQLGARVAASTAEEERNDKAMRNAVPGAIASGTSEIQKVVIARHLGL